MRLTASNVTPKNKKIGLPKNELPSKELFYKNNLIPINQSRNLSHMSKTFQNFSPKPVKTTKIPPLRAQSVLKDLVEHNNMTRNNEKSIT